VAIKCQYCLNFLDEKTKKKTKECPFCLNEIDINANKCPYCDEILKSDLTKNNNENIINKLLNSSRKNKLLRIFIYFISSFFIFNILFGFFISIRFFIVYNNIELGESLIGIFKDLYSTHTAFFFWTSFTLSWGTLLITISSFILLLCSFRKYRFKICFYILPFSLISSFAIIL
jgi:hypothetical protein